MVGGYEIFGRYGTIAYYSPDFEELPAEIDGGKVEYAGDGWYRCRKPDGMLLISPEGTEYVLAGVDSAGYIGGELVAFSNFDNKFGIMTLSGEIVIPPEEGCYIYKAQYLDLLLARTRNGTFAYKLDGSIFAGIRNGTSFYETEQGLLGVTEQDCFTYLDKNGDTVFRVSLLAYTVD